jgi:hypothetical protein
MKKVLNLAEDTAMCNLKMISETNTLHETAPYILLKKVIAGSINFNGLTVPFQVQHPIQDLNVQ